MSIYPPLELYENLSETFIWFVPDGWDKQIVDLHNKLVEIDPNYTIDSLKFTRQKRSSLEPDTVLTPSTSQLSINTSLNRFAISTPKSREARQYIYKTYEHLKTTCIKCGWSNSGILEVLGNYFPSCKNCTSTITAAMEWQRKYPEHSRIQLENFMYPYESPIFYSRKKSNLPGTYFTVARS